MVVELVLGFLYEYTIYHYDLSHPHDLGNSKIDSKEWVQKTNVVARHG